MPRPRHPNKEIERALEYAESHGWAVRISDGHAWGRILCPYHTVEGCQISIWSTPKVPEHHARRIIKIVERCDHGE